MKPEGLMLKMLSKCELCRGSLAADGEAWICSYECTYCADCHAKLEACPNCGGELVRRPKRTTGVADIAQRFPDRARRVIGRVFG